MTSATSSAGRLSAPSPVTEPPRSFTTTLAPWRASSTAAPPTFSFAWQHMGAFPELQPDTKGAPNPMFEIMGSLREKGGLILHGEQEFEYHRAPVVGDDLVAEGKVSDVYEKESKGRTMTF